MKVALYWIGYSLLCLTVVTAGMILAGLQDSPVLRLIIEERLGMREDPFEMEDEVFLLVLGEDENRQPGGKLAGGRARTDTIQLVRFDLKGNTIGVMQIPRDTLVDLPGRGKTKINAANVYYGPEATINAVTELTGIRPDRTVIINYGAVMKLVDAVGGVEIDVPKNMNYDDERGNLHIHLDKGQQTLSGEQAVGFLRYRRDNDFYRGERQQIFLDAFRTKVAAVVEGGSNILALNKLATTAFELLEGDLDENEAYSLGQFAKGVPVDNVKRGKLPVDDSNLSNLVLDESRLAEALIECGLRDPGTVPAAASR